MPSGPSWYASHGNSLEAWYQQANSIMWAAGRLIHVYARPDKRGPSLQQRRDALLASILLRVFVLECLLKARWLAEGKRLVVGNRFRGIPGVNNHDLVAMASTLGVALNDEEIETLRRLRRFGEIGRYPITSRMVTDAPDREWRATDSSHFARVALRIKGLIRERKEGV